MRAQNPVSELIVRIRALQKSDVDLDSINISNREGELKYLYDESNGATLMVEKPLTEMTEKELVELNLLVTAAEQRLSQQDLTSVTHIEESAVSFNDRVVAHNVKRSASNGLGS